MIMAYRVMACICMAYIGMRTGMHHRSMWTDVQRTALVAAGSATSGATADMRRGRRYRGEGGQEDRGTGVQGYRGTGVQGYKGTGVQGYRGTGVQGYRGRGRSGLGIGNSNVPRIEVLGWQERGASERRSERGSKKPRHRWKAGPLRHRWKAGPSKVLG